MPLITLEHGRLAYALDFAAIGVACLGLGAAAAATAGPRYGWSPSASAALVVGGVAAWTLIEYAVHRFVLHGVQPFRRWHAQHHRRPGARIYAPTWLSGSLVAGGVLAPLWLLADLHVASAVGFGVVLGNLTYAYSHHVAHRHRAGRPAKRPCPAGVAAWRERVRHWHALHHARVRVVGHYGVTTRLWDRVFGTDPALPLRPRRQPADSAAPGDPGLADQRLVASVRDRTDREGSGPYKGQFPVQPLESRHDTPP